MQSIKNQSHWKQICQVCYFLGGIRLKIFLIFIKNIFIFKFNTLFIYNKQNKRLNPNKCESILSQILPQIQELLLSERSQTPQPIKKEKLDLNKENNPTFPKHKRTDSSSPFCKNEKIILKKDNKGLSSSSINNKIPSFKCEDKLIEQSNNFKLFTQNPTISQVSSIQRNIFESVPLQISNSEKQDEKQFSFSNYFQNPELEQNKSYQKFKKVLNFMRSQHELDHNLIQQQSKIISILNKEEQLPYIKSFAEASLDYQSIQHEMNIIYLSTKCDILLHAFSRGNLFFSQQTRYLSYLHNKVTDNQTADVEKALKKLINTKSFLSSSDKEQVSNQLIEDLQQLNILKD